MEDGRSVVTLARRFNVSRNAMAIRVGIPYDTDNSVVKIVTEHLQAPWEPVS